MVALHAPSQWPSLDRAEIKDVVSDYRSYITQMEESLNIRRTIVVGDMNLDPYDAGMVSSHAFHAVMAKELARRGHRIVSGVRRRFFYNPMWGFFGDRTPGPPGTLHYAKSGSIAYYWNMFDQVLLRPEVMDELDEVQILTTDGCESLLNAKGCLTEERHRTISPFSSGCGWRNKETTMSLQCTRSMARRYSRGRAATRRDTARARIRA